MNNDDDDADFEFCLPFPATLGDSSDPDVQRRNFHKYRAKRRRELIQASGVISLAELRSFDASMQWLEKQFFDPY